MVLAGTGEGALTALRSRLPDLVLLDLKMPHGSGVDVIREVRTRDSELPVIIITGYPDSELLHQALDHSPLLVMAKPVDPEKILKAVSQALAGVGREAVQRRDP